MTDISREPSLTDYLVILRRRWRTIATVVALLCLTVGVWTATQTATYAATSQVIVAAETGNQSLDPTATATRDLARQLENERLYAKSRVVLDKLEQELGYRPRVTVNGQSDKSDELSFTAEGTDREAVATVADRYAQVFIESRTQRIVDASAQTRSAVLTKLAALTQEYKSLDSTSAESSRRAALEQQIALFEQYTSGLDLVTELASASSAQIVSAARVPDSPISPRPLRNAVVAVVFGLFVGTGVALVRDFLDDRVATKEELEQVASGATTLALVPLLRKRSAEPTHPLEAPHLSEAFRGLRTAVQFVSLRKPVRSLQVTSAEPAVGKSTCSTHLATAVALGGQRVVIIDADLRKPTVADRFGIDGRVGLTTVMLGQISVLDALQSVDGCEDLFVLPSGEAPENAADFLWPAQGDASGWSLRAIVDYLVDRQFFVIVDSPPILPVADALTISRTVDATLFVASASVSKRRGVRRAFEMLEHADARVIGTVLNRAAPDSRRYANGYGYGYGGGGTLRGRPEASHKVTAASQGPEPAMPSRGRQVARVSPPPRFDEPPRASDGRADERLSAPVGSVRPEANESADDATAQRQGERGMELVSLLRAHLCVDRNSVERS